MFGTKHKKRANDAGASGNTGGGSGIGTTPTAHPPMLGAHSNAAFASAPSLTSWSTGGHGGSEKAEAPTSTASTTPTTSSTTAPAATTALGGGSGTWSRGDHHYTQSPHRASMGIFSTIRNKKWMVGGGEGETGTPGDDAQQNLANNSSNKADYRMSLSGAISPRSLQKQIQSHHAATAAIGHRGSGARLIFAADTTADTTATGNAVTIVAPGDSVSDSGATAVNSVRRRERSRSGKTTARKLKDGSGGTESDIPSAATLLTTGTPGSDTGSDVSHSNSNNNSNGNSNNNSQESPVLLSPRAVEQMLLQKRDRKKGVGSGSSKKKKRADSSDKDRDKDREKDKDKDKDKEHKEHKEKGDKKEGSGVKKKRTPSLFSRKKSLIKEGPTQRKEDYTEPLTAKGSSGLRTTTLVSDVTTRPSSLSLGSLASDDLPRRPKSGGANTVPSQSGGLNVQLPKEATRTKKKSKHRKKKSYSYTASDLPSPRSAVEELSANAELKDSTPDAKKREKVKKRNSKVFTRRRQRQLRRVP
eukprot:TRINITY_DN3495_c0_g1_i1.p1 TRINITY_DN3495_c0_g1~~TRINITY_DN3495_c0_g1_i1.p1  ORF type:complete len:529 (+),score=154.36 TRINITY_DN3495_c0_g1_i1:289-1875(+)